MSVQYQGIGYSKDLHYSGNWNCIVALGDGNGVSIGRSLPFQCQTRPTDEQLDALAIAQLEAEEPAE